VHELTVSDVDPHVGEGATKRVEEHQVAGLQFIHRHRVSAAADVLRTARKHLADRLLEHVTDQPAAVEAGIRRIAAKPVVHAQQSQGAQREFAAEALGVFVAGFPRRARRPPGAVDWDWASAGAASRSSAAASVISNAARASGRAGWMASADMGQWGNGA
jgi:hypothetical protein